MANRFPLVLDTADGNKIKEIQTGDNLYLADNSITGVQNITALGTIDAAQIKVAGNFLVAQQFANLTDTPATFVGSESQFVKVNAAGTGIEFASLGSLGTIQLNTVSVDVSIVPTVNNVGTLGTDNFKFNEVASTTLKGNLAAYDNSIVFNATTGKISYAALQGAPTFLSEFTDDVGFLQTSNLDTTLAGLFDDGVPFVTDIVGSVFGDDSTIMVDGVAGKIVGPIETTSLRTSEITIAIGQLAGNTNQATTALAIGGGSGMTNQSTGTVAIGYAAARVNQGVDAVAIGQSAGDQDQGASAVAIGGKAGLTSQAANSIVLNATGSNLNNTVASSFVVKPVRNTTMTTILGYDAASGEIMHNAAIPGYTNTADLKALVAASTDFADYQTRIAAL